MNGKVLYMRNNNYTHIINTIPEQWIIAVPVDMVLSALRENGQASFYTCDGMNGYGDHFVTQLSHCIHNGKEWVGSIIHGDTWLLPEDMYADFDLSDMEQAEDYRSLTIIDCDPTEKGMRKAFRNKGWKVISKIPKKYLTTD